MARSVAILTFFFIFIFFTFSVLTTHKRPQWNLAVFSHGTHLFDHHMTLLKWYPSQPKIKLLEGTAIDHLLSSDCPLHTKAYMYASIIIQTTIKVVLKSQQFECLKQDKYNQVIHKSWPEVTHRYWASPYASLHLPVKAAQQDANNNRSDWHLTGWQVCWGSKGKSNTNQPSVGVVNLKLLHSVWLAITHVFVLGSTS